MKPSLKIEPDAAPVPYDEVKCRKLILAAAFSALRFVM
jgi:hypothetical protein